MTQSTPIRPRFRLRGFTSLLLAFCFIAVVFSGAILYISPQGKVAHWTDWSVVGLGKEEWASLHTVNSLLLLIVSILHLVLNFPAFWGYMRRKAGGFHLKLEVLAALIVAAGVIAGTVYGLQPFRAITDLNDRVKRHWAQQAGAEGPVAHAEELSVQKFAEQVRLAPQQVADALRAEGYAVPDHSITIAALAAQKLHAPRDVYAAIRKHHPDAVMRGSGGGGGSGLGELTLDALSAQSGIAPADLARVLTEAGYSSPTPDSTLHDIAATANKSPRDLIALLRDKYPTATLPRSGAGGGGGFGGGGGGGGGFGRGRN